jgi:hypothetical protein
MPLLNYTTQIDAAKTVMEIQAMLAKGGALAIMTEYDGAGVLFALTFRLGTPVGPVAYKLPCNVDAVSIILTRQAKAGKVPRRLVTKEQAARVGWRIIKDWVEAQLALVETQMVSADQVFLPYAVTANNQTVYERFIDRGMSGLLTN